ncbi:MAG: helix-turn-helix domain-containing protein, partial [Acidobacteria bacterium]|nr:helix-turn-helix domain-containing protein [Acidobacteriota bacterium]
MTNDEPYAPRHVHNGWRLTATEYRHLHALSLDAGGLATFETLIRRVWGEKDGGNVEALRSAVAKLR